MKLKSGEDTLNYKRLLSLVLPTAVILSACQRVSATELLPENTFQIVNDVENYHQVVTIKNETNTNEEESFTYSATEATLFPADALAYGSSISKGTNIPSVKTNVYSNKDGAYQKTNQSDWLPAATTGPLYASLEIYPYQTFIKIAEAFTEKGIVTEGNSDYTVTYSGIDSALNQEVSALLGKHPNAQTHYDVTVTVDKETNRLESLSLKTEVTHGDGDKVVMTEMTSHFSKYNYHVPK